jgi:acetyl esterase/lipase
MLALAAAGLAALTMGGLAMIAWRGVRAKPALERALTDGLGADWRASIDAGLAKRLRRRLPWAGIVLGVGVFVARPWQVRRVANIPYGDAGREHLLDVFHHRARRAGAPVLVHLHGGRFIGGRKSLETRVLLHRLARQGWVCVSANYRLSPGATFPDYVDDAKRVIAWVREHGQQYGADPSLVFVAGCSAGAHIASMTALTPNQPEFQPGFEGADTSVAAAIGLYGYYGLVDSRVALPSSPKAYVGDHAPPFLVVHGGNDTVVPAKWAREFVTALEGASASPVAYAELPGAQHGFDLVRSIRSEYVVDAVEAFAAWVRSSRLRHSSPDAPRPRRDAPTHPGNT